MLLHANPIDYVRKSMCTICLLTPADALSLSMEISSLSAPDRNVCILEED